MPTSSILRDRLRFLGEFADTKTAALVALRELSGDLQQYTIAGPSWSNQRWSWSLH